VIDMRKSALLTFVPKPVRRRMHCTGR
jgi:hypothetical protein